MADVHQDLQEKNTLTSFQRLQNELAGVISSTPHGDKLPSEPMLAKMLGVSRATLRECIPGKIKIRQGINIIFTVGQIFFQTVFFLPHTRNENFSELRGFHF